MLSQLTADSVVRLIQQMDRFLLLTLEEFWFDRNIGKGTSLIPKLGRSVESIPAENNQLRPYEIITVHKRGFAFNKGDIIRKAHVTTVRGNTQ
ncbi:hypothetical protein [Lentibacillus sp. CBA3610]|uniref:hypothetical protein n=1 Tax=Lentibacillus sp. CBA3610 TaxID=2518176 RepID=UPI0015957CD5|nr:hypothetical protein [Lentibacillus sp. CBA3610]